MTDRTEQDLLAERRSAIREQLRERDKIAIAVLQFQIDEIDREIASRRTSARSEVAA